MFEDLSLPKELIPSDPRFAPGPSLIPQSHILALHESGKKYMGMSHRAKNVKNLVKEMQEGMKRYFEVPAGYEVILGNGGATCLFDLLSLNLVDQKVAHFVCGEFSEKWAKCSQIIPGLEVLEKKVEYGKGITPTQIPGADVLCMTLNETSTGVRLDAAPAQDPNTLIMVDATSGAAQVPWKLKESDVFFFSPQKVFASDGGLWVAIMSPKALERAKTLAPELKKRKRYIPAFMELLPAIENSLMNQTTNTPAIATIFLLNEQVKLLNSSGYSKVVAESLKKSQIVYDWAEEKPYLRPFIQEKKYQSNAVATIDVDDKIKVDDLIKKLEAENAVHGIAAYRKLGRNQFRIALFHDITTEDVTKLTKLLSYAIEKELK